ncbi:serine/threonine-protein kinase drkB [Biomphalaria glabrata]|uniref:Uncharacterized protein LOC106076197 isoform X2 n=1 Tax=Biomphalaria glabrata TaxID=6526 RepID=A0A9W3B554_BIOGL|nr:uncharacterized protein LOC106076197 isoform X2 [Biomphalaria glabrata]
MTSSKKTFQGNQKSRVHVSESEKLRRDVEELEDALLLHSRYHSQTDSVRGLIRKEIDGSHWEHGGDGKLTTYHSKRDLIQPSEMKDRKHDKNKLLQERNETSLRDYFNSGAVNTKEKHRSRSSSRHSKKEKQKIEGLYVEGQFSNSDWSRVDTDLTLKGMNTKDKKLTLGVDRNAKLEKVDERSPRRTKQEARNEHQNSRSVNNYSKDKVLTQVGTYDVDKTTLTSFHSTDRKKEKNNKTSKDHLVIAAAQSTRMLDADPAGRNPVSSLEISYTYMPPGPEAHKQQSDLTYQKTLEFLMSQLSPASSPHHAPREKTKRHRSSELSKDSGRESRHESRRHTGDGRHISSKFGATSQGVSYLDSRTWQPGIKDSIPDERTAPKFEKSYSGLESYRNDRFSLSPSSGDSRTSEGNKFEIDFPGLYSFNSQQNLSHKTDAVARNQSEPNYIRAQTLMPESPNEHLEHSPSPVLTNQSNFISFQSNASVIKQAAFNTFQSEPTLTSAITTKTWVPQDPTTSAITTQTRVSQDPDTSAITTKTTQDPATIVPESAKQSSCEKLVCDPDVRTWLESLGLQSLDHYIQLFAEHQMDIASVRLLTTGALRDMGINALGPIMKIIKGVQILCRHDNIHVEKSEVKLIGKDSHKTEEPIGQEPSRSALSPEESNVASLNVETLRSHEQGETKSGLQLSSQETNSRTEEHDRPERPKTNAWEPTENQTETNRTHSSSEKSEKGYASKKSTKKKLKTSRSVVKGKPPLANKVGDDGVAAAAKKFAAKRQEQIRKLEVEEKNLTARKQIRDELTTRHQLRRSSSLERNGQGSSSLARSSSFTCVGTAIEEQDKNSDVAKTEGKTNKKRVPNLRQVSLEKYARDDSEIYSVSLSDSLEKSDGQVSPHEEWNLGNIWALKKQLFDIEMKLAHKEDMFKQNGAQGYPANHQDVSGTTRGGGGSADEKLSLLQLEAHNEAGLADALPGLQEDLNHNFKPSTFNGLPPRDLQLNATSLSKKHPLVNKDNTAGLAMNKDDRLNGADLTKMAVAGHSMAIKGTTIHRDFTKQFQAHTKIRPDLTATASHLEDLKKVKLDKNDVTYSERDLVGDGTFSQVFRGDYKGTTVAVKRLKFPLQSTDKNYFAAEVSMLQKLHHPNVLSLLGVCNIRKLTHIVLEFMPGGNLHNLLHGTSRMTLGSDVFYKVARDISSGVYYLHHRQPPVLHLNLNSHNVLLGPEFHAKIADFGFSKLKHEADTKLPKTSRPKHVTGNLPLWMAPELICAGEVTAKADIYSFAVVLWEMITNKLPYEGCSVYQVLEQVRTNKRPLIPDHCPPDLCRLIQKCWDQNPAARPGFKEILKALEQLSVSQIWKAPDLPLNAFQNDELDPKKEVPFNNLSLSEPELKVTKVFEPSEIISQIEDKTRLELKSISSESDSESFVLVENNLGHSIPMDIPQLSGQFTSTENSTLQELAQAHITSTSPTVTLSPVLNLSKSSASQDIPTSKAIHPNVHNTVQKRNNVSNNSVQKATPKSFQLPGQVMSKSNDFQKSSHVSGDKLLPLRHSMDKPQAPSSVPFFSMSPSVSEKSLSSRMSDEALAGLISKYTNKNNSKGSRETPDSASFTLKPSVAPTSAHNIKTPTASPHCIKTPVSNISDSDSVNTSTNFAPSTDIPKRNLHKPVPSCKRSIHTPLTDNESFRSLVQEELHPPSDKRVNSKASLHKDNVPANRLADTYSKLDIKPSTECVIDSLSEMNFESKLRTFRGSETIRTVESPRITKPDSQSTTLTNVSMKDETLTNVENTSIDQAILYSDSEITLTPKDLKSSAELLTESVPDISYKVNNKAEPKDIVSSSVSSFPELIDLQGMPHHVQTETASKTSTAINAKFSIDIDIQKTSVTDSLLLANLSQDSSHSSSLDSISEDSLCVESSNHQEDTGGTTLPESQEVMSPRNGHHSRTSSPKPQPTKSIKYNQIKPVTVSSLRTPETHKTPSLVSPQESFFLSEQFNKVQPIYLFEGHAESLSAKGKNSKGNFVQTTSLIKEQKTVSSVNTSTHFRNPEAHNLDVVLPTTVDRSEQAVQPSSGVPPAPALKSVNYSSPLTYSGSQVSKEDTPTSVLGGLSKSIWSQEHLHPNGQRRPQPTAQDRKDKTPQDGQASVGEQSVRFSLEASMLKMQKGQLKSVKTREPPPLVTVIKEVDDTPTISVASILKKALIDRRFAMGVNHDSADFTPDASWSMQDEEL